MKPDFRSYFDSYQKRSPVWAERVRKKQSDVPGFDAETIKKSGLVEVTPENHPKIYQALKEECEFRGVEMPACYVDHDRRVTLGAAIPEEYTLIIDERSNRIFTQKEMRALVAHELKHLYQAKKETAQESLEAEYDSDRAAVSSTDYKTIRSYVDKAIHMMIDEKVPISILRKFMHGIHDAFPGLIAENFMIPTSRSHPSPASRMSAMRSHADKVQAHPENDLPNGR
jgi:hypothetical protein